MLEAMTASTFQNSSDAPRKFVDTKKTNENAALVAKAEEILAARRQRKAEAAQAAEMDSEQAERELAEQKAKYANLSMAG